MNKPLLAWTAIAVALLAAGGVATRMLTRPATGHPATAASAAKAEAAVELATTDVTRAATAELVRGLALTGTLRAVNTAMVKARVAGELQGLSVREGDTVSASQEIARIDAAESQARLRQAREQADAARAHVQIAQRQFDNNQALVGQGFISRTALESSQSNLSGAQASYQAALAAVDVARKALDDTVLRAPISGAVSQRLAQPGERVGVDARVVEIVDPSRLELEAQVGAAESLQVRVGQQATLSVEGLAQPVQAVVARINPSAQVANRSLSVYLAVTPAPGLRQGLFAQGRLATGRTTGVAVPLAALRTDKPAPYVQVVENERVAHKPVTPGARGEAAGGEGGQVRVEVAGLAEGAVVILGHVGPLREGTLVRFTRPLTP